MLIERAGRPAPLAPAAQAAKAAPAAQAAPTAMAKDQFKSSDIRVITFNTAIGNPTIKTKQEDFLQLPFYQEVLKGAPNAPIMCLQEVGNAQRDKVEALAKSGHFTVLSQKVGLRGRQNNMVLIPKRFEVLEADNTFYKAGHLKGVAKSLWGWAKGGFKGKPNIPQLVEPRGYQELKLRDKVTGKTLTVFNSHTSYYGDLQVEHVKELMKAAKAAEKHGPVIVGGDLNTRTAETDPDPKSQHARARAAMDGYADMGPKGTPPGKTNIDWVLAKGFESVASKWYTGDSISLPGSPDAKTVSDHYAEENVLRFN